MLKRSLAAAVAVALIATPASASVNVGDNLHAEYDACIAKFTAAGMRDLVDQLDKSVHEFIFKKSAGTISNPDSRDPAGDGTGTGGTTKWNPTDTSPFEGDNVAGDPCATLYHEMSHLADYDKGTNRRDTCRYMQNGKEVDTGISVAEVKATRKENEYRAKVGLPLRTHYGKDKPLPPDGTECLPAPPPRPSGGCNAGCAIGAGDPHLRTFDGHHYDFQAVGEFVLTRSTAGDPLEVQGRASPLGGLRTVSLFSAVAANVNGDRVGLYREGGHLRLNIAGQPVEAQVGTRTLAKGGAVDTINSGAADIRWPDGSTVQVQAVGNASIRFTLRLAEGRASKVEGLFGDFDGKEEEHGKLSFEELYKTFGEGWRVKADRSLFDYGPGQSTETFTDRTFPDRRITAADLPNRATAEAICRGAGVTAARALEACIIDVGLTGEVAFALDAVTTQHLDNTDGATLLTVAQAGGEARLTFPGTQGQKVFIEVPASNAADQCSPLELRDPSGRYLGGSCIINGFGYIDTVTLPANGDYVFSFTPKAPSQAYVRVTTAIDQELTITPNGPRVTSVVSIPGSVTRLRFQATAGQRVFINVPASTLPDQCSPLELRDAQGKYLASGCVIGGRGYVDGTLIPADGEYTILVNPNRQLLGTSQLNLIVTTDQSGPISIDGPAVQVSIGQAGGIARLTFNATAGQTVSLEVTGSTLPDQCSPLELRDPSGRYVASGCVIDGKGQIRPEVLPVTGVYTILVDPNRSTTGVSQLRLRSS